MLTVYALFCFFRIFARPERSNTQFTYIDSPASYIAGKDARVGKDGEWGGRGRRERKRGTSGRSFPQTDTLGSVPKKKLM